MGLEYPMSDTPECDDTLIEKIKDIARSLDLKFTIGAQY